MLALAKFRYGMAMPQHMGAVLIFIVLGVLAIRSIGLIVAVGREFHAGEQHYGADRSTWRCCS